MTEMVTIGTCSRCGGPVKTPRLWSSVEEAPRVCAHCGAQAARHGPVIDMGPAPRRTKCAESCFCTEAREGKGQTGSMFVGPGLVPYKATGMVQLDADCAQVLSDNLWDLYTTSGATND